MNEIKKINKIRNHYLEKKPTTFDQLKTLDKKVKMPALIFAYVFGTIASLILGTGMCIAMKVIFDVMALGIVIGIIGIALCLATYPIYKRILNNRKEKYSDSILDLSDKLLNV